MIRAAIIGSGQRSVSHLMSISRIAGEELADIEVAALVDIDENRAKEMLEHANSRLAPGSRPIQAPIFTDYRTMLDKVAPDCIYLCVPPFVHGEMDHVLADYGKPIFFEKPIALDMAQANEIAAHLRQNNVINCVGYQMRYSSTVQIPRQMLALTDIGMVISIRLSNLGSTPWWRVQSKSGGMLTEQHTHAVDLMRYLCGEIETAYAVGGIQLSKDVPNLDIFDVNACTVRFANGAPGIIGNSCAAPAGAAVFPPHLVHVVARDLVLSVNVGKTVIRRPGQEPTELTPEANENFLMNQAFIDAIQQGHQAGILSSYDDALRTLAVTLACQRSAEIGQPIEIAQFMQA